MDANLLKTFREAAEDAAHAGAKELEHWRTKFTIKEKGRADLVTEADVAAQKAIQSILLGRFPDHHFLGEEDGRKTNLRPAKGSPPTWVVDPLDGTSNYVHDCPQYCVSIGLWADEDLQVGVIFDPRLNEMFSGANGLGATLNGYSMEVSKVADVGHAMLSTGFPSEINAQMRNMTAWLTLTPISQALRRTGSTALNLAYVACGRHDGYWAYDNYPWDVAAGMLLVREAGGTVSRIDGAAFDPFQPDLLATNGRIQAETLGYLARKA